MTKTIVKLANYELHLAAQIGLARNYQSWLRGSRDSVMDKDWPGGTAAHIAGVMGELAVAKYLGVYYDGSINTFKDNPDISARVPIECRHRIRNDHDLIVRKNEDNDSVYIHTTGGSNHIILHGWIVGHRAKISDYLANHGGHGEAYFVPSDKLNPIVDLIRFIK